MEVPDDDIPYIVQALRHQAAYQRATNRDEQPYKGIAERLERKGPGKEDTKVKGRKKQA